MHLDRSDMQNLQLVHTLSSVPMQESLSPEHGRELVTDTLEQGLDADADGRSKQRYQSRALSCLSRNDTYEVELAMKVADILRPRGGMSLRRSILVNVPDLEAGSKHNSPVGHLNVVGDPLNELVRVLGLHTVDVVLDLLHGDLSSPVGGNLFEVGASHQEPQPI